MQCCITSISSFERKDLTLVLHSIESRCERERDGERGGLRLREREDGLERFECLRLREREGSFVLLWMCERSDGSSEASCASRSSVPIYFRHFLQCSSPGSGYSQQPIERHQSSSPISLYSFC